MYIYIYILQCCCFYFLFCLFFGKWKDDGPTGPYNVNHLSHFWKTYIICKSPFPHALASVLYISPPIINGIWWVKPLTVTLHHTSMLKQLYLMTFEMGHVAFMSTPSHFSVILFPKLGKKTLLFISVVSIHLTPVVELNRQRSSFDLHSFCIFITSSSSSKNEPSIIQKWVVLPLLVITPHRLTPLPMQVILLMPSMHHH